jgi:DNA-binding NarL/FixJ family response regulator
MESTNRKRAILRGTQPLTLSALKKVLATLEIDVVATTRTPNEALAALAEHEPDLFVTDHDTAPDEMDVFSCIVQARAMSSKLRTVVLATSAAAYQIQLAFEAGADAFVVKTAEPEDVAAAIRQAFEHSIYFPPATLTRADTIAVADLQTPHLTRREVEILRLVSDGHSNGELARMLWVTEQTIKFHLSNIYRKLNVSNRTEASRWAQLHGLLPAEPPGEVPAAPSLA